MKADTYDRPLSMGTVLVKPNLYNALLVFRHEREATKINEAAT
jgi:hypothetical protein